MASLAIQGMQWGDEGKGKVTDFYASKAQVVVRSQGGNNAGHTIVHHGKKFALRLIPSGIFSPEVVNILADGTVINPSAFIEELEGLEKEGIASYHLLVSSRAQVLMPYHIDLDHASELVLAKSKIGTTGRGIGPCYADKAARLNIRMGDLLEKEYLKERLDEILPLKNKELASYGLKTYTKEELLDYLMKASEKIAPLITDTSSYLNKALAEGKKVLFEGAQGAMLCLDHGTYPYVTSSSPLASGIPLECGIPNEAVKDVLGIMKAYTTRVGEGPFPSEIQSDLAQLIRDRGHEYGTVTKRPRRIGWLDAAQLKYVKMISGVKYIALMLLDVLSCTDEIKICTGYLLDGKKIDYMPSSLAAYLRVKPVFETMPSWKEDISNIKNYADLPLNARNYISRVEELTNTQVVLISVGPDKDQTIIRKDIF
ncbi:MAG: adenylosuccinate synthase [Bacilli bacterium]|jgi:adenylosuccinate synthase|nr:adenylosuccinate synthase [Bacilli bacterium]